MFINQENHSRRNVFEKLQQYAFPLSHKLPLFAFECSETFSENGWTVHEPIAEYKRMVQNGFTISSFSSLALCSL